MKETYSVVDSKPTLRDQFAMAIAPAVITSLCAEARSMPAEDLAELLKKGAPDLVFQIADAMLVARERPRQRPG